MGDEDETRGIGPRPDGARVVKGITVELGAFAAALIRRWYLVVVALALAAGAGVLTVSSVGPTYQTQASILLFPPSTDGGPEDEQTSSNPYLELGGLNTARDILIRTLTSQSQRETIVAIHPGADYALMPDSTSSGPILLVEIAAPSAREALAAQATLLSKFPRALEDLQEGLGLTRPEFITARELTVDDRAAVLHKSQIRAAIVAVAVVLLLTLALIGFVDGWLAARADTRRARQKEPDDPDDEVEVEFVMPPAPSPGRVRNKQARRSARDDASRAARAEARELDRAST